MGIGFSLLLLAVGAILTFALDFTVVGVDINIIGWILMAAGAIGLILTMAVVIPRRRRTTVETQPAVAAPTNGALPTTRTTVDEHVTREVSES